MFSPFAKTALTSTKGQQINKSSPNLSITVRRSLTPSSRNLSFGRSYGNSFLDESLNPLIERYASILPVLITEAITLADKISDISVKLEPFGYASLVCGRQLLIWKYKQEERSAIHCKELTLPPSDLAHKAELVHLFQTEDSKLPSALAVSPEGHVRYWPNINHEGSSVDAQPDLQGQECCSLTSIYPLGCILATTSSSLVIITPTIGEGQPNVICRTLCLPLGVLAGIGRKVSSFIFGPIAAQNSETKLLNRVLAQRCEEDEYFIYVLCNSSLQKWHVSRKDKRVNSDQLLFEMDLDKILKQSYSQAVSSCDPNLTASLETWCIDTQLYQSGVMIFAAGTLQAEIGGNVQFAFGFLETSLNEPPQTFSSFLITTYSESYQEGTEENLLNYKFLLPSLDTQCAYIYDSNKVLAFQIGLTQAEYSEVNFASSQNVILGSGSCEGVPLFFTKNDGIISFVLNRTVFDDPLMLASMKDVSIRQTDPKEPSDSLSVRLREALISFCANNMEECEKVINEVLSHQGDLDEAVIKLSLNIIDDYPVSDPRWCEALPTGSVTSSMLISYQLQDKLKVHECLISFLKAFHLIDKLSFCKVSDTTIPTNILLCEHAEKLVSARAFRSYMADHFEVIETAVQDTLDRRGIEVKNHLTPQDVFFREVSTFHTILPSLIEWETEQLNADESIERALTSIMTINKIFSGLLQAITKHRQNKSEIYGFQSLDSGVEFVPWTSREGSSGIRQYLRSQLNMNVNYGLTITDSIQIQGVLFQQYVEMLDFYLETYRTQLQSLKKENSSTLKKEFEKERSFFIKPLFSVSQYERAAALAEKYLDFDLLIQICEETKNSDRLQRYMHQFSQQSFSEFVFKWYLDRGQKGKIFDKNLGHRESLGNFLQQHESLKWLYFIQEEKYDLAHTTLKQLALKETEFLGRKKTLLSLSKLCAMISDIPQSTKTSQIEAINLEQDLIAHQEALPILVVEAYGIDPRNMRVFPPEELIEMYIAEENTTANAFDFKIALDLLSFIKKPTDDPGVFNLRMRIWSKAILRNNWEALDINNPLESIKETAFFQIIELAFDQGVDMYDFMPSIDDLLESSELLDLADNPSFRYLLQAGYEHVLKIIA